MKTLKLVSIAVTAGALAGEPPIAPALDDPPPPPREEEMPVVREVSAPVPNDVTVEVLPRRGGHRVTVRREGHVVALRKGRSRAAGRGAAWIEVASPRDGAARAPGSTKLTWESTSPRDLATDRGVVTLRLEGDVLAADLALAAPPAEKGAWNYRDVSCRALDDGGAGFVVLCKTAREVVQASSADLTSPSVLDGAWTFPDMSLTRLDLPAIRGGVSAKVMGFRKGRMGVVLRAEGTWLEGEDPTLVIQREERAQPEPSWR